jgi:hypothetical protein
MPVARQERWLPPAARPLQGVVEPATSCGARLRLRDGHQLSYLVRGAPDGFPVFHFHGAASCMLEAPGGTDASASARAGVRLIISTAPGTATRRGVADAG